MIAALKDYWLVWRYAMYYHKGNPSNELSVVTRFFVLLLALASPVFFVLFLDASQDFFKPGISGPLGFGFFAITLHCLLFLGYYWRKLLAGVMQYSRQPGFKLLPRIARRAYQITFGIWLLLAIVAGLSWQSVGGEFIWGFVLVATLLPLQTRILSPVILMFPWWLSVFAIPVFSTSFYFLARFPASSWEAVALPNQILGYAWGLFLAWITFQVLRRILLSNSPKSAASERKLVTPHSTLEAEAVLDYNALLAQVNEQNARDLCGYEQRLRDDCTSRNTTALAAHTAGPSFYLSISLPMINRLRDIFWPSHWTWFALVPWAAMVTYWLYIGSEIIAYEENPWPHLGWLITIPMLLLWMFELGTYQKALITQIREQNLFRLSPLLPSPFMLNQHLARHLMRNVLQDWLRYFVLALMVGLVSLAPLRSLLIQLSLFSLALPLLASLPLVATRHKKHWLLPAVISVVVLLHWRLFMVLTEPFSNPLFASHSNFFQSNWADVSRGDLLWHTGFAASNMLLAALLLVIRWRAMARVALAFPAGRFGAR